jgi:predicted acyltransferase
VNWETAAPGNSVVRDGLNRDDTETFGLTSFTWSLGYVLIMWLMLWFLHRNRLFSRVQAANFVNPMNASTL